MLACASKRHGLLLAATSRDGHKHGAARTDTLALCLDMIDKATKEIKQDEDKTVYKSLDEIGDDLPDHSPRFVLLSYPMTLVSTRPCHSVKGRAMSD